MERTRPLLCYLKYDRGVQPQVFHSANLDSHLSEVIEVLLAAETRPGGHLEGQQVEADRYVAYDWELNELSPHLPIAEVPRPGIIILVPRGSGYEQALAFGIREHAIGSTEPEQQQVLRRFLSGPEGRFEPHTYDVFVSYASPDHSVAQEVCEGLERLGLKSFMAKKDLKGGMVWEQKIRDALRSSRVVVVILTPDSIASAWVMCEAGACWALGKPMVPAVMYVEPRDLPEPINRHQAVSIKGVEDRKQLYEVLVDLCRATAQ